jgi:hypothetical protein
MGYDIKVTPIVDVLNPGLIEGEQVCIWECYQNRRVGRHDYLSTACGHRECRRPTRLNVDVNDSADSGSSMR